MNTLTTRTLNMILCVASMILSIYFGMFLTQETSLFLMIPGIVFMAISILSFLVAGIILIAYLTSDEK